MSSVKDNILELLLRRDGRGKSFVGANLKGSKLENAKLNNADMTGADLGEADLRGADLTGANLTRAQVIGTDFTGATLTGACIEDWNISHTTKLERARCEYVYLLRGRRERRPLNPKEKFGEGEFGKFFQKVFGTVDFIFRGSVDWEAFVKAFAKLQVEFGDTELKVQGVEDKGDGTFVIKVAVPVSVDKEVLYNTFIRGYEELARLNERHQHGALSGVGDVVTALQRGNGKPLLDAFISYASENRDFVDQLVSQLQAKGLTVWYDRDRIAIGDSFSKSIHKGLMGTRFGVIVLSPEYFKKYWTMRELDALFQKEEEAEGEITLPLLYGITAQEVAAQNILLASKKFIRIDGPEDIEVAAKQIQQRIRSAGGG